MKVDWNTLIWVQEGGEEKIREAKEMDESKAAGSTYIVMLCSWEEQSKMTLSMPFGCMFLQKLRQDSFVAWRLVSTGGAQNTAKHHEAHLKFAPSDRSVSAVHGW